VAAADRSWVFTLLAVCTLGCEPQPAVGVAPARTTQAAAGGCACAPPPSFAEIVAVADPAVVFIETTQAAELDGSQGLGSGFVVDPKGVILTNYHVVRDAKQVHVVIRQQRFKASIVGVDPPTDLAVLSVDKKELPYLVLGDSARVKVGEWVVAIGNPFGLSHTVSAGIVSALGRTRHDVDLDPAGYYNFLQTDASINPGNSGGPLLGLDGRVIAINTAIRAGANSIGFAIPIDMVKALLPRLLSDRSIKRSGLGLVAISLEAEPAKKLGIQGGAVVQSVQPGGAADKAGLRSGDVIVKFDGARVEGKEALRWVASIAGVGHTAELEIRRGTRTLQLRVALEALSEG
jgi:serine protease Do